VTSPRDDEFGPIRAYGLRPGMKILELTGAFTLTFTRAALSFEVTVASSSLEWFVEIADQHAGLTFKDWADYAGYDNRPRVELVAEMTEHLHRLMRALLSADFRLLKGATWLRPSDRCEWRVAGRWVEFDYSQT
jgi:hypothetical protein